MLPINMELKREEKAIFHLRSLFEQHGYSQFKMNKFEEYDLYVRNKDFLISDNINSGFLERSLPLVYGTIQ